MDERRVHALRLHAHTHSGAQHAAILLEDALRTATLPGASEGRLVLVRRLDLGAVDLRLSSASLALQVEQRMRDVQAEAVYAGQPGAAGAKLVYFRDRVEALVHFIRRLSQGEIPTEWFWPLAVPGWQRIWPTRQALRWSLRVALQPPGGPLRLALLLAELLHSSPVVLDTVLAVLEPGDGTALLAACGWRITGNRAALEDGLAARRLGVKELGDRGLGKKETDLSSGWYEPGMPAGWETVLARWVKRWGGEAELSLWMAGIALVDERPARLESSQLMVHAAALCAQIAMIPEIARKSRPPIEPAAPDLKQASRASIEPYSIPAAVPLPDETHRPKPGQAPAGALKSRAASHLAAPSEAPQRLFAGEFSAWSGLYFLLGPLKVLGLPEWLAQRTELIELGMPQRILSRCAGFAGVPPGDPILAPLTGANEPLPGREFPLPFVAPPLWQAFLPVESPLAGFQRINSKRRSLLASRSGLLLAIWSGRPDKAVKSWLEAAGSRLTSVRPLSRDNPLAIHSIMELVSQAWLGALRRWVRWGSGLSVRQVVQRPGRIHGAANHIEVSLPLEQADLRLRRAGLDLDPGWLPWLGRVVLFHYTHGE